MSNQHGQGFISTRKCLPITGHTLLSRPPSAVIASIIIRAQGREWTRLRNLPAHFVTKGSETWPHEVHEQSTHAVRLEIEKDYAMVY